MRVMTQYDSVEGHLHVLLHAFIWHRAQLSHTEPAAITHRAQLSPSSLCSTHIWKYRLRLKRHSWSWTESDAIKFFCKSSMVTTCSSITDRFFLRFWGFCWEVCRSLHTLDFSLIGVHSQLLVPSAVYGTVFSYLFMFATLLPRLTLYTKFTKISNHINGSNWKTTKLTYKV